MSKKATIIEYHASGRPVEGEVEYSGERNFGWRETVGGHNRTTIFGMNWEKDVVNNVTSFRRRGPDIGDFDVPPETAEFYIIIR